MEAKGKEHFHTGSHKYKTQQQTENLSMHQPEISSFLSWLSPAICVRARNQPECFHCVSSCPGHPGTDSAAPSKAQWEMPPCQRPSDSSFALSLPQKAPLPLSTLVSFLFFFSFFDGGGSLLLKPAQAPASLAGGGGWALAAEGRAPRAGLPALPRSLDCLPALKTDTF